MSVFDQVSDPNFQAGLDSGALQDSTSAADILGLNDIPIFGSIWNSQINQVDPTNTGNTGANQDTSTPALAGQDNPETGGGSSLGAVLNNAINAGFSAWQLASLPKSTPKTVTTQVGQTRVVAGSPSLLSSIVGPTTSQGSQLLVIGILIIVGILIYKSVKK